MAEFSSCFIHFPILSGKEHGDGGSGGRTGTFTNQGCLGLQQKKRATTTSIWFSVYIRNTQLYYILQPWLHERKWFTFLFFCLYRRVSSEFQTFWVSSGRDLMKWGDWFYHFMFDFTIKPNLRAGIISIGVFSRILQAKQKESMLMLGHFRVQPQV